MAPPLTAAELERYSRHLSLQDFGLEGQLKLKAARVLVVGAGGLGSPALLYLAAAGVGVLGIVDHDAVDISNLQRQVLYESADVGRAKADVARQRLLALNPELDIVSHAVELRAANILEILCGYDVVLDGTDRFATRYLVNDACVIARKPLVSAAIHRFEGQAMTYVPEQGPCYRCLFAEPPADGAVPNCAEAGVLGVLPGVMGSVQATEAIKLIVGRGRLLIGRLLTYDALDMSFGEFRFARRADCAVCGEHPTITRPQDPSDFCGADALAAVRRIDARELQASMTAASVYLVDVRESHEYDLEHLRDAVNVPLTELPQRLSELPRDATVVFMCRSGTRSLRACGLALTAGMRRVAQLEGGLLAWRRDVASAFKI